MGERWIQAQRDFGMSVFYGSTIGSFSLILLRLREVPEAAQLFPGLVLGLAIALVAAPLVALGLAIFGVPVTWALEEQIERRWAGYLAVVWGAVAGKLMFYLIDRALGLNGMFDYAQPGLTFGIPTGLAWWLLTLRRRSEFLA